MTNTATLPSTLWQLRGQLGDDELVQCVSIDTTPFTVGRRQDQALTIPSPTVSGRHAELAPLEDRLVVRDLGSTNGTFVNGVRVHEQCEVNHGDLIQFAQIVFRACTDVQETQHQTQQNDSADRALALIQFDKLMSERAVVPYFQPVIRMGGAPIGYEILARSRLFGLADPETMFMAAAVLRLEAELSRIFRIEGIRAGATLRDDMVLFANTHPSELEDPEVLEFSLREARDAAPQRPLVLEIHEATATDTAAMRRLRAALDELSIGLAYDDFGAGQARLLELADVPPDYLKFDMKLVQGIHAASLERQKMVARLVEMTVELGAVPLAEGVEEQADHEVCEQMGFRCAQGFLYGRPAPIARGSRAGD